MVSFDPVVDEYDAARPGYPDALFDALGDLNGVRVLEGGAGTGIATRALLARGARVVAFDVSAVLLDRARRRSPSLPAVVGDGADLPFRDGCRDLLCFAQSWHWLRPVTRCVEARRVLASGGRWAGWWSHARADGERWFDDHWSTLEAACPGVDRRQRDIDWGAELDESGLFVAVERTVVPWTRRISVDDWLVDLSSHSYVAALDDAARSMLVEQLRRIVLERFPSGSMEVLYETWVWIATAGG
jgi:SAM-dependent methyltransferase